jgi:5'-methylthioadenosine phosphorylase
LSDVLVGLIGGSGLGAALTKDAGGEKVAVDTPFGAPSAPIILTEVGGQRVAILARHGEGHRFNPSMVPYCANIFALKKLGVTHILASGATGILTEKIAPRELVICDQVIDKTLRPGRTFFDDFVAHVEFAHPFCEDLRQVLVACGRGMDVTVHPKATYVCMEGPQFSTRAESLLHRAWGADLIGMTTMPEAKLAREAEMCYALLALPTDYDCWKAHEAALPGGSKEELLKTILGNLQKATDNAVELLKVAAERIRDFRSPCDCQDALKLAIWSDKTKVDPREVRKLDAIVGRYF